MSEPTIPSTLQPEALHDYLAVITRAVFQAGVSWRQIAEHWEAYVDAFAGFDPQRVAAFDAASAAAVLATPGILRSPRKIAATIHNARALLEIAREFGTFHGYLSACGDYETVVRDMRKRFSHLGPMNVWYVLFRVREPVPRFDEWIVTIEGEHPRMREMVDAARAAGTSPEITR